MKNIAKWGILVGSLCYLPPSFALQFTIKAIEVEGVERIARGTVLNYLPVKVGEVYNTSNSARYIQSLYKTGLFADVQIGHVDNTLVVTIVERPTISRIRITGNDDIDQKKLLEITKAVGLTEGQVFNPTILERTKGAIMEQYLNLGRYNAQIDITLSKLPHNLIAIDIKIDEGDIAKIREINIIGNEHYSTDELLKGFSLSKSNIFSYFSHNDRYSKAKLAGDLETLRSFYLDRGYVKFQIDSTQVSLTPDKKWVYVTLHVNEGKQYRIKEVNLKGKMIVPEEELQKFITIKPNDIFSRKIIMANNAGIAGYLGDRGYANATVQVGTEFLEDDTIILNLTVEPGKIVYVRRISFAGNVKTSDEVLRRETIQPEGAVVSLSDIQESARRLRLLDYVKDVRVTTAKVPGFEDQMDIAYSMQEVPSAKASVGVGWSSEGPIFNVDFNQDNFLGSGKTVGFAYNNSKWNQVFSVYYNNPYYTINGISRGFSLYSEKVTPGDINLVRYTTSQYGGNVAYGIPVAKDDRMNFSYGYDHTELSIGDNSPLELQKFVKKYGRIFNQFVFGAGWQHIGQDQAFFPTDGLNQYFSAQFTAPSTSDSLQYYKVNYRASYYQPLIKDFILTFKTNLGFGDGYGKQNELPFFKNYFAGGIGSVRGFRTSTLGPRDTPISGDSDDALPLGGNLLVTGTMGLIVPQPISEDLRTSLFIDAGNVFNTHDNRTKQQLAGGTGRFDIDQIRVSAGLEVNWRSPMGPLVFSLAAPIRSKPGDEREPFQFTIGTSF